MYKIIKGKNLRNAFPVYFNDVYTTLTYLFKNSEFEVVLLSENTIQIKRYDDNLNLIVIEFQDEYIEIIGYFYGLPVCDDETEMTQKIDNLDNLFLKIEEALRFEWGKVAEMYMYSLLVKRRL